MAPPFTYTVAPGFKKGFNTYIPIGILLRRPSFSSASCFCRESVAYKRVLLNLQGSTMVLGSPSPLDMPLCKVFAILGRLEAIRGYEGVFSILHRP